MCVCINVCEHVGVGESRVRAHLGWKMRSANDRRVVRLRPAVPARGRGHAPSPVSPPPMPERSRSQRASSSTAAATRRASVRRHSATACTVAAVLENPDLVAVVLVGLQNDDEGSVHLHIDMDLWLTLVN